MSRCLLLALLPGAAFLAGASLWAGPYSGALNDPGNIYDAPVPGFIGPDGEGNARLDDGEGGYVNARNRVNPLFFGWAVSWSDYKRSDEQEPYNDPNLALGPVTGDNFDVVSLGDLTATQIAAHAPVGRLTLQFTNAAHPQAIHNLPGADFVVFENGLVAGTGRGGAGTGGIFADLAYVEVSSDGVNFARFPSVSQTAALVGPYGTVNPTNVFNLAGKHANAYGDCWGTPFDLSDLANHPLVQAGTLNLNNVRYVRVVDIPGDGSSFDGFSPTPHSIYDAWVTVGSGGMDLEAIGAISVPMTFDEWQTWKGLVEDQRGAQADPDGDGVPNLVEYALSMDPQIADAELLPKAETLGAQLGIRFRRDLRATQARVEVSGTADLHQPWQVIARAEAGGNLLPVAPFSPVILDANASNLASVGVVRRHDVSAISNQRFLRIVVTLVP